MNRKPLYETIDKQFAAKEYKAALASIDHGLAQDPHDLVLYRSKARIYHVLQDFKRAVSWYGAVIRHSAPERQNHIDRAAARNDLCDYAGVIEDLNIAELMREDDPALHLKRGGAYWELRDWAAAERDFARALELAPDNPDAIWVNGLLDLQMGRFATGWARYEARWRSARFKSNRLVTTKPQWSPESGLKRVLVWGEQGLGDQILYASMLGALRAQVDSVTMMVDARLVTLLTRSYPDVKFLPNTSEIDSNEHDSQLPIASIGAQFVKTLADIPRVAARKYLRADPERVKQVAAQLKCDDPSKRLIGISWTSAAIKIGPHKSMALEDLEPILSLPRYQFVNLQYMTSSTEKKDPRIIKAPVNCRDDIEGLAALLTLCNSVVSVSSTTVHLAAALGVRVRLADANKLWYWGNCDEQGWSLWYPSVRVYPRRNIKAPWHDVIKQIRSDMGECNVG